MEAGILVCSKRWPEMSFSSVAASRRGERAAARGASPFDSSRDRGRE
jgi:hypothetical protein